MLIIVEQKIIFQVYLNIMENDIPWVFECTFIVKPY